MNLIKSKTEARKLADRLCKRLGKGWTPIVWENLDWNYKAVYKNVIHVHPANNGTFFCTLGELGMLCSLAPEGIPYLKDPVEVVRRTVAGYKRKWDAFKKEQNAVVQAGEEACGRRI